MADTNANLQALPRDENYVPLQNSYRTIFSGNGTVTTAGTPVQVKNVATQAKIIDIINPTTNADIIVIGDSTVSHLPLKGIPIEPGFSYRLNVTDLSLLWIDSAGNGYTFSWNAFK